jgi:hypothetical protein
MLSHFQYQPLYENKEMPGWRISFYFKNKKYNGFYNPDGSIEWTGATPPADDEDRIKSGIHELMLFHVYDGR